MSASQKKQSKSSKSGISLANYGKIDSSNVSKQLWLARLPPKLAEVWDQAPEGTLLGHLVFTKGTPKQNPNAPPNTAQKNIPQKLAISVSEDLAKDQSDLPLDYTLANLTTKIPSLYPFTRHPNGSVSLHGVISRSCNMQMERTERYREMCKSRLLNTVAGKDKRHVKPVHSAELSVVNMGSLGSGFGSTIANFGKKVLEAQKNLQNAALTQNRKRKFDETQSVRSILFELFSQQQYWSVKELRAASGGRAEKEIRAELQQIAEFKRSGEFKGMWELKKDFAGNKDVSSTDGNITNA
jgi:Transcription initiation factor IIF, small subunit (RAP30)